MSIQYVDVSKCISIVEAVDMGQGVGSLKELLRKDYKLKSAVIALYRKYFGELNSACNDCYFDAFVAVRALLKKTTNPETGAFVLNGGVIVFSLDGDMSKSLTNATMTEDLCLYHFATNPHCKNRFAKVPDDLESRVAAYIERCGGKAIYPPPSNEQTDLSATPVEEPVVEEPVVEEPVVEEPVVEEPVVEEPVVEEPVVEEPVVEEPVVEEPVVEEPVVKKLKKRKLSDEN